MFAFKFTLVLGLLTCSMPLEVVQGQPAADVDNSPPTIEGCPNDIVEFIEFGNYMLVSWTAPTALDDSGTATLESQNIFSGSFFEVNQPVRVNYTFSDQSGNKASCVFTVSVRRSGSVEDTSAPIITGCPLNPISVTVSQGRNSATATWIEPTATDGSGVAPTRSRSHTPGSTFPVGRTFVTYRFTDGSGNSDICQFWVDVLGPAPEPCSSTPCLNNGRCQATTNNAVYTCSCINGFTGNRCQIPPSITLDNTPPTIEGCPDDIVTFLPSGNFMMVSWTEPTATDDSGTASLDFQSFIPGTFFEVNVPSRVIYAFTDSSGNEATCRFTVSVRRADPGQDITPPVIISCPLNAISATASPGSKSATATWPEPTATDDSGMPPTRSRSHAPGSTFSVGTTVVTYRFTDGAGNTDTCQFQVVLEGLDPGQDITPPAVINCPLNAISATASPGSNSATATWTEPIATDDSGIPPTRSRSHAPGSSFSVGTTVVTYRFTDGAGNSNICQFQVVVETPTTGSCTTSPCLNSGQCFPIDGGLTFVCFCPPGFTGNRCQIPDPCTLSPCLNSGQCQPTDNGDSYFCGCVNGFIGPRCETSPNGVDRTPPTIDGCPNDIVRFLPSGNYMMVSWTEPTVTDDSGTADLDFQSLRPGTFFEVGVPTEVIYTFADSSGNEATCRFTVSVRRPGVGEDISAPVIIGCPLNAISVAAATGANSAMATWTEPTATDDSGVAPQLSRSHSPGSLFPVGTMVVTYRFTDGSGNSDACQFQVIVTALGPCSSSPCLNGGRCESIGNNDAYLCNCINGYSGNRCGHPPLGACISSPCFNNGQCQSITGDASFFCNCVNGFTGDRCQLPINVPPTVTNCPDGIRDNLGVGPRKPVFWVEPTARDSSGTTIAPTRTHRPGMMFDLGQTTVGYTFTANGQTVRCIFTVTIVDNTPPVLLTCPSSISHPMTTVERGITIAWDVPSARDNSNMPIETRQSHQTDFLFTLGTHNVTYNFTDSSGNKATCRFTVTIIPDVPNPCSSHPCPGETHCFYRQQDFICIPRNIGRRKRRIDDCPCKNGSSCIHHLLNDGSFCQCLQGYSGILCEQEIWN